MTPAQAHIHDRLAAGRAALAEFTSTRAEPRLIELLQRLDDALADLHAGDWGVCRVCHEVISREGMEQHPLVSVCLECMSEAQREALQRDLHSAGEVQRALLPAPLRCDGWEVDYLWEPHGVVSGDHVDLIRACGENEPAHLLLGDVAGKGVAASLVQSQLHALFRALAPSHATLSAMLERANRLLFEGTSSSRYATMIAARLHPDGRVVLANAGHPRPLLADHRGVRPVEGASIPLGMFGETSYSEREIQLRPGDTLLLYTDGLTEAWRDGDEYGVGRAAAALRQARDLAPTELLAACRQDVERFVAGRPWADDLTVVAVRRGATH